MAQTARDFGAPEEAIRLKWPNDVLLSGAKLSGLLIEYLTDDARRAVTIGIGVNLAEAPEVEAYDTAALSSVASAPAPDIFLEVLDRALFAWLATWREEGFEPLREAWLASAAGLGGPVTVRLASEEFTGVFEGLSEEGALLVGLPEGVRPVTAGDVFFPAQDA